MSKRDCEEGEENKSSFSSPFVASSTSSVSVASTNNKETSLTDTHINNNINNNKSVAHTTIQSSNLSNNKDRAVQYNAVNKTSVVNARMQNVNAFHHENNSNGTIDMFANSTNTHLNESDGEEEEEDVGNDSGSDDDDDDDDDDDANDLQMRLLLHAKATAQVHRQSKVNTEDEESDETAYKNSVASALHYAPSSSSLHQMKSNGNKSKISGTSAASASAALQALKKELTKPVEMSTALTIVNAADESNDTLNRIVHAKISPAPVNVNDARKLRKLRYVNHSEINYLPIIKDLYVAPPDVKALSKDELRKLMKELDGAKMRGSQIPRPLRSWHGTGLPDRVLAILARHEYHAPFAVQSVGIPVLMSGRDLLVTAKTGSGKTLCYALPLIRHCLAQKVMCDVNEGPMALVLVPTQELAAQVYALLQELCQATLLSASYTTVNKLRCVASYGSTSLADNIRHARSGCEVMVCTPGRLLDLLTVNNGNVMNLERVSFVVIDEADRLFDSGFMEHVSAFLKNIRPDRQVAMISATMPKELKKFVLTYMHDPIEITVGGRPTPASNVEQRFYFFNEQYYEVEIDKRQEDEKFVKLMQIVGEEANDGSHLLLIFTQHKSEVDALMSKMSLLGYENRIATLYSGMDPIDREFALEHFAPHKQFILIATAIAERGLDMPFLSLVINYSLPNHYEAYVHRIGRTGRAGKPGRAISFFTRGRDDDIAPELVDGLERAEQQVPEELYEIANKVRALRKEGLAKYNCGFYRGYLKGKSLKLTNRDEKEQLRQAAKDAGLEEYLSESSTETSDSDEESSSSSSVEGNNNEEENEVQQQSKQGKALKRSRSDQDASDIQVVRVGANVQSNGVNDYHSGSINNNSALTLYSSNTTHSRPSSSSSSAMYASSRSLVLSKSSQLQENRVAAALAFAQKTTEAVSENAEIANEVRFQVEYLINDLPDVVRNKLQSGSFLRAVADETNTTLIRKGVYYDAKYKHSHKLKDNERPLYLLIIGKTTEAVQAARRKLNETKEEILSRQRQKTSAIGAVL